MKRLLALVLMLLAYPAQAQIFSSYPYTFQNGTVIDAAQVNANFNAIGAAVNANAAHSGTNSDITSLSALTAVSSGAGTFTGNVTIGGNATVGGTFGVTGIITTSGAVNMNGAVTMTAAVGISNASPTLVLNKLASGQVSSVLGTKTGLSRWSAQLGNITAESGANAGSDFSLFRYNDAGTYSGQPLTISRLDGSAVFENTVKSLAGGFVFPDNTVQTTALPAYGSVGSYTLYLNQGGGTFPGPGSTIAGTSIGQAAGTWRQMSPTLATFSGGGPGITYALFLRVS